MKSDTNNHSIGLHSYKMSREGDSINKNAEWNRGQEQGLTAHNYKGTVRGDENGI